MSEEPLDIVFLGLPITSSWGNGHATTYRALLRGMAARGHRIRFLERETPWHTKARDLPDPSYAQVDIYQDLKDLQTRYAGDIRRADCVIVGSYVPEGINVCEWVLTVAEGITVFYDIDTPVTLAKLQQGACEYISADLIPRFSLYLSFVGGPVLEQLERDLGASRARALYCCVDPDDYHPEETAKRWDLGFLGTYSEDSQSTLQSLLIVPASQWPAGKFIVAGAHYPSSLSWPTNVERADHLAPSVHPKFYNEQLFTLNLTRRPMAVAGYSPSVRLFEAAACGTPIITDSWEGLEEFFEPADELLVARTSGDVLRFLQTISSAEAKEIGAAARKRVLAQHTPAHRAAELEQFLAEARERPEAGIAGESVAALHG